MTFASPVLSQVPFVSSAKVGGAIQSLFTLSILLLIFLIYPGFRPRLRSIPGPFFARFTNIWRLLETWKGHHHITLIGLHRQHGSVVRIGPNALSISSPNAIESIYGVKVEFVKVCHLPQRSTPVVLESHRSADG